jgi:hypothetical protein
MNRILLSFLPRFSYAFLSLKPFHPSWKVFYRGILIADLLVNEKNTRQNLKDAHEGIRRKIEAL